MTDSGALVASHVSVVYPGGVRALDDVSINVERRRCTALLGDNGAGKSTLFSLLAGVRRPTSGHIHIDEHSTGSVRHQTTIGYAPQDVGLYPLLTAAENLALFAKLRGLRFHHRSVRDAIEMFSLGPLLSKRPQSLSGGQQRRVHTAIALVGDPDFLLLDEPTAGVDAPTRDLIFAGVRAIVSRGGGVLYSSHHLDEISDLCDLRVLLHHGCVVAPEPLR